MNSVKNSRAPESISAGLGTAAAADAVRYGRLVINRHHGASCQREGNADEKDELAHAGLLESATAAAVAWLVSRSTGK
jgi:hypothetical protein